MCPNIGKIGSIPLKDPLFWSIPSKTSCLGLYHPKNSMLLISAIPSASIRGKIFLFRFIQTVSWLRGEDPFNSKFVPNIPQDPTKSRATDPGYPLGMSG
jgi:hypothetical protein